ncbi:MAG: DMT family transporter [Actinobacteria bacterium]|nr:DMT family transporter [Actinomycetota bacterium]
MEYLIGVIAAVLLGIGFVLQQGAAQQLPKSEFLRWRLLLDLLRKGRWLAGIAAMVAGQLLSAWLVGHVDLSLAEPLLATNLIFALVLAGPLSRQPVHKSEIIGALILMAGVACLSVGRSVHAAQVSVGSAAYWPYAAAGVAAAAYGFAVLGRRRTGVWRATFTGVSAGTVFGLQDALTRRTILILTLNGIPGVLTTWSSYGVILVAITGLWLTQSAFNAAPLHASLPAITAGEPVCGIVLGIIVFGDPMHVSPGLIALQACGFAALVLGVILVARAPALSGLLKVHVPHHQPESVPDKQAP